jgi:hypothetical protein
MIDQVVENVVNKYYQRSVIGAKKYGTTLYENNKDNYLKHLQEELMDATLYLQKLMDLKEELTILVKMHGNDADLGRAIRNLVK